MSSSNCAGAAPSFLLLETDDSTTLTEQEDGGEAFVFEILDSPVLADRGVEQLMLRHSSSDDEGPFVLTFLVPIGDLRTAAEGGLEIEDAVSVQVERP